MSSPESTALLHALATSIGGGSRGLAVLEDRLIAVVDEAADSSDLDQDPADHEIVGWLGAGGMGEVYRAHDARLGREVAIKLIREAFAADPRRVRRFELEARTAGQLNHPNVIAVYDVGSHNGAPYIVSELLEGLTLRERLKFIKTASLLTA